MMSGLNSIASRTIFKLRPLQLTDITLTRLGLSLIDCFKVGLKPLDSDLVSSAKAMTVNTQKLIMKNESFVLLNNLETKERKIPMAPQTHIGGMLSADKLSLLKIQENIIIRFSNPEIMREDQPV